MIQTISQVKKKFKLDQLVKNYQFNKSLISHYTHSLLSNNHSTNQLYLRFTLRIRSIKTNLVVNMKKVMMLMNV